MDQGGINKTNYLFWTLSACLAADLLSLIAFTYPVIGNIVFILLVIGFSVLAWRAPTWALVLYLVELILGSKGYLFFYTTDISIVSLRIAWFIILISFWLVHFFAYKQWSKINNKLLFFWGGQMLAVSFGAVTGFINNEFSNWFLDLNGYIYLLILWPLFFWWSDFKPKFKVVIWPILGYLAFKTLLFVYLYSHFNLLDLDHLYHWFRDTGFGEINYVNGSFFRIFSQSHIFVLLSSVGWLIYSLFLVSSESRPVKFLLTKKPAMLFFGVAQICALLASLSRSFWLGAVVSLFIIYVLWIFYKKNNWKKFISAIVIGAGSLLLAIGLLYAVMQFPWPTPKSLSSNMLLERTSQGVGEAAGAARLQLLGPLWSGINKNIFWGQGFGATVTYLSTDPRIVKQSLTGQAWYTTYAFEWGYLDMWLKFGFVGLVCFLAFFAYIIKISWSKFKSIDYQVWLCYGCLLALLTANITTPYLNHPLGIGIYLLIGLYLFFYTNERTDTI